MRQKGGVQGWGDVREWAGVDVMMYVTKQMMGIGNFVACPCCSGSVANYYGVFEAWATVKGFRALFVKC